MWTPLLDNAYIIPYHITHESPTKNMLALCPTCHRIADDGDYSETYLRKLKANPFNKSSINERFLIENDNLILNLARNRYVFGIAHKLGYLLSVYCLVIYREEMR